jgi:hypothetical protein
MLKKSAGRTEFVLGCWRYCAANSAMGTPTALLTAQTQLERLYLHQLQCSAKPQRNSNAAHFNRVSFRAAKIVSCNKKKKFMVYDQNYHNCFAAVTALSLC